MSSEDRRGIKLIDLMVAIFVIAVGLAVLLPALSIGNGGTRRRVQCANNMRQLGLALINFSTSKNHFPNAGTFHDDPEAHGGDPAKSNIYMSIVSPNQLSDGGTGWLHSWVVDILPYLDQQGFAEAWDRNSPYWWQAETIKGQPSNDRLSSTSIGVLRCPDDVTAGSVGGNLSYAVNGGFARWHAIPIGWAGSPIDGQAGNGGIRQWTPPGRPWQETQAISKKLGVMFLGTDTGDQPWDIKTTPGDVSDGSSRTILIAENTLAGFSSGNRFSGGRATNWACPLPNFVMFIGSDNVCASKVSPNDCLGGQLALLSNRSDGPGWARANRVGTYENMNFGKNWKIEGSFPFANSGHPGGANFVFCDGAVRFLSESIDGTVYAKLITPAGGRLPASIAQGAFAGDFE